MNPFGAIKQRAAKAIKRYYPDGIEEFESIYIYDLKFRTDHRFETYNSSGYIHKKDSNTLLLKSRHKSEVEIIRLIYASETEQKSAELVETDVTTTE